MGADAHHMMMFQPQMYGHFNQGFYGYPMHGYNSMWKRDAEADADADAQYYYNGYFNRGYGHFNRGFYGYPMSYGYNYTRYYNSRPYGFYNNQWYGNQYYGQRWGQPQN